MKPKTVVIALLCLVGWPRPSLAQPQLSLSTGTSLFRLNLSGTPAGEIPASIELLKGTLEVALKNGVPMLKASSASEFLITLPQALPPDFTLEIELVPKLGSNPQDLSFEGTPRINQGDASAHVLWHATGYVSVIGGGGDTYEAPMPDDLKATLPGVLTRVALEVQGPTLRLYTNGRRLYTLQKQFARGQVLRVFLGGQNGQTEAVYLAGLRVTVGTGLVTAAQAIPPPGVPQPPGSANTQQQAVQTVATVSGSVIQQVGGTRGPATVASPGPGVTATPPASAGAISQGPLATPAAPPPSPPAGSWSAQRTVTLAAFTAAGGWTSLSPRSVAVSGFVAAGMFSSLPPVTITVSGFTASGSFSSLAPRAITLSGFVATGSFVILAPRTITLSGWTAGGVNP